MNKRVKEIRLTLNLTLKEFGKKLGVTSSSISLIENGNRKVTDQMILAICREFDVNETWLRTGEGNAFISIPQNSLDILAMDYNLNELEYLFLEEYLKLSSVKRKAVFNFVSDLLGRIEDFKGDDLSQQHLPVPDKKSIDERVEDYRRQLEAEEKVEEKSSVLRKKA